MKKMTLAGAAVVALMTSGAAFAAADPVTYHTSFPSGPVNGNGAQWSSDSFHGASATGGTPNDTTTATTTTSGAFAFSGTVNRDCSFAGSTSGTPNAVPIGTIGVRNGEELAANLFVQADSFVQRISSASAGCNFNNTVTVTKSAQGLVNSAAGGFDNTQFTANIPYTLRLGLAATTNLAAGAAEDYYGTTMATGDSTYSVHLGAWRSNVELQAGFAAQTKGLVAGTYKDTVTVTLAVDAAAT